MTEDFFLVVRWWGVLFLVGAAALPLTKRLFGDWWDGGYLFSKAVGMAVVGWIVYVLGTVRMVPFGMISICLSLGLLFLLGIVLRVKNFQSIYNSKFTKKFLILIFEELIFFGLLLFWAWIKAHEPSIRGLEKFMDFGFMKSILVGSYFPAPDMWYAGHTINYYYFGHIVTAALTKLSGIDLSVTFNLMLATIFALTFTMSFSIGKQICQIGQVRKMRQIVGGLITAFLVTLAGNMQTLYAFTKGYTGDNVKPFWELWWTSKDIAGMGQIWGKVGEGLNRYWYANATRFIPFTIHEFPGYSFVVSDIHGHVLSLPFVLLAIALLIQMSLRGVPVLDRDDAAISFGSRLLRRMNGLAMTNSIFYGFLVGVLLMTNALDGPIYFALAALVLVISNFKFQISNIKIIGLMGLVAVMTSLPFIVHFKSFVSGIAVNCPPGFLANTKIGPLLFEEVTKCQHSPLWMLLILWGFFLFCGAWLIIKVKKQKFHLCQDYGEQVKVKSEVDRILIIFFLFSIALIIIPEFFYFKDIYPMHFRSNTMFKLGYQAFILFSIVSGYAIITLIRKKLFFLLLLPQLFLVSIFPIFAVRSYFGELKKYEGLDGLRWIQREYPDDWVGIEWLNREIRDSRFGSREIIEGKGTGILASKLETRNSKLTNFALVEADGDSYTDYNRFSVFTGMPTVVGWAVHEWLWRGGYDAVAPRREEVAKIYESTDLVETENILKKYHVRIIVVGTLERTKYKNLQEWKFSTLGKKVFQSNKTVLYEVRGEMRNPTNTTNNQILPINK